MSIEIMSLVFKAAIPTTQKFVLIAIADHCNSDGKGWPSIQRIASHTSLQTRTVYRAIHDLEAWGILSKSHNPHSKSTLYTINKAVLLKPLTNGQMTHDHLTDDHPDTRSPTPLTDDHPTPDTRSPTPLTDDHPNHNTNHKEPSKEPSLAKLPFDAPVIEKPPKAKKPRAMQMPQGWKPHDAHRAKCASHDLNPEDLAEKFENYHASKGNLFVDWDKAFFTWIGNAKEFNQSHRGSNNESHRKPNGKAPTIDGETGEIINDQPSGNSFGNNPKRDQGMDKAQRIYAGAMHLYESKIRQ
ncbi:Helix-turn-helix domain containing protein [uncultured Caudovirales phage]|uniref:Helix-turn-helix domain containing protein n=1 Tax=uncultured Caudovirales phage TaxID=2100421 RepID=A0A6J5LZC8_9CAUD|nr:Helix-turn-helix domain containing protein [uncultured Caudovirales phage]